ncbi:MAG: hypothetical protein GYA57_07360, partial [Myxococcales bacterium]|nr:hypothetical protein [Myxococcales bacterium]
PETAGAAADAADAAGAAEAAPPPPSLRDDAARPDWRWDRKARRVVDRVTLPAAFRRAGYTLPDRTFVYAARIVAGVEGPAYELYQAGGGAFSTDFWPASTVKLLAALAALEYVRELGFTGAARVTFDLQTSDSLRAIVDRALRVSSNSDYDLTLLLAGIDRLNREFLTPERGFPTTVIQRSYTGLGVPDSPACTLEQLGRTRLVPARRATPDDHCPDGGNCATLFELAEALRRVVLHDELPPAERFDLDDDDRAALLDALCVADSSPFLDGATRALGTPPRICHKTGSVGGRDFLDHALIESTASGERWILAASVPDQGGATASRTALGQIAEHVLRALRDRPAGFALQPDAGTPIAVQLDRSGRCRSAAALLTIDAPGATTVAAFLDGRPLDDPSPAGPGRFTLRLEHPPRDDHLLALRAERPDHPVAYRSLRISFGPPAPPARSPARDPAP